VVVDELLQHLAGDSGAQGEERRVQPLDRNDHEFDVLAEGLAHQVERVALARQLRPVRRADQGTDTAEVGNRVGHGSENSGTRGKPRGNKPRANNTRTGKLAEIG
jgi:hypothetical protein